ncbi:MAG: peptidylprolyl isomerase [Flavobacteriales bacterium]|nr:peptidylprolyl isomerase [Flavobacteriales bacterium]
MTALQTLRHHQGLLVGLILFALFAFVLGEVISSRDRIFSGDRTTVASIGDNKLNVEDYRAKINEFIEANKQYNVGYGVAAEQIYNQWVMETVLYDQYMAAGISVGTKGTMNGILGLPDVKQYFTNAMGEVDENALRQWVNSVRQAKESGSAEGEEAWKMWQDMKQRGKMMQMSNQYSDMVSVGLIPTALDAKIEYAFQNDQVDGKVAFLSYASVDDKEVAVTDAEIESYVSKHADDYKRSETRDIQYALVPIVPSEKDADAVKEKISELLKDKVEYNEKTNTTDTIYSFERTKNDSLFVNANTDAGSRFNGAYQREIANYDLSEWLKSASKGSVFGPYKDEQSYKLTKLMDVRSLPDSVRFSHILISYQGNQYVKDATISKDAAKLKADSLAAVLKSGKASMEALAAQYSNDPSVAQNKGLQEWVKYNGQNGEMESFVFTNPKGSIKVIESPVGYHVIRVEDAKAYGTAYKLATVTQYITPSKESAATILSKAQALAKNNATVEEFVANAVKQGYDIIPALGFTILEYPFKGVGDNTSITRWAFEKNTKVKDTKIFDIAGNHVVAILSGMREEGKQSVADARAAVEPIVMQEKKAEILKKKFAAAKGSLDEIAKAAGAEVLEASSMTMVTPIIAGAGRAPETVGTMFGMKEGQVSAPVVDETGVMVATVTARRPSEQGNTETVKNALTESYNAYLQNAMPALQTKAQVKDNRAKIEKLYN